MSGPTDTVTDPPLPYDDSAVYEGRRLILNRIDQEWPCNKIIGSGELWDSPNGGNRIGEIPVYTGGCE
jgi:hypothetical protein